MTTKLDMDILFPPPDLARTYWHRDGLDDPAAQHESEDMDGDTEPRHPVATPEESNLTGSLAEGQTVLDPDGWHLPVIDFDIPATLRPSSTAGHGHLYIEHPVRWSDYVDLLRALAKCGLVEDGYVEASVERGQTFVRTRPTKPGAKAPKPPIPPARWLAHLHLDAATGGGPRCDECGLNESGHRLRCMDRHGVDWHLNLGAGRCGHCAMFAENLAKGRTCFDCGFWLSHVNDKDEAAHRVVVNGNHYVICAEVGGNPKYRGMGGSRHVIRFFDGREVATTNLWGQGEVPEHFRDRLPDNAEFAPNPVREVADRVADQLGIDEAHRTTPAHGFEHEDAVARNRRIAAASYRSAS